MWMECGVPAGSQTARCGGTTSASRPTSTHITPDPVRTRKLLLHSEEISKLIGKVEQRGYTLVPLNFHYKGGRVKCEIGLAKGKKQHDKRETEKKRDWERIRRAFSRSQSRFFSLSRLSCSFLPLASPISHLTRPPL